MFVNMALAVAAVGVPVAFATFDTLPFQFAGVPAYEKAPVHKRLRRAR